MNNEQNLLKCSECKKKIKLVSKCSFCSIMNHYCEYWKGSKPKEYCIKHDKRKYR